jgi:pimeloyl-ACP methyl ester carboxylesterase
VHEVCARPVKEPMKPTNLKCVVFVLSVAFVASACVDGTESSNPGVCHDAKCDDADGAPDPKTWSAAERAEVNLEVVSLDSYGVPVSLELPLDPAEPEAGTFQQFYFMDREHDPAKPTVLYIPDTGAVVQPATRHLTFLTEKANVVYFHLRGSGLSQIPASNDFDRFLRTRYAIGDVEAIRESLNIEHWDAVFANSLGTMLAQRYSATHPERVGKLVLTGAPSKHETDPAIRPQMQGEIIRNVINFTQGDTSDLAALRAHPDKVELIADRVVAALEELRADGLSGAYIITEKLHQRPDLDELLVEFPFLRYPPEFFAAALDLGHMGWRGNPVPVRLVSLLAHAVLVAEGDPDAVLVETPSLHQAEAVYRNLVSIMQSDDIPQPRYSPRLHYVFSAYDGLNSEVLEALEETGGDVPTAFDLLKNANTLIPTVRDKVGVVDEPITPWDPAAYPYTTPTLLVQGTADSYTFRYQAEHIYEQAARGPVVKVVLAGVGHSFRFPGALKFPMLRRFVTRDWDAFVTDPVLGQVGEYSAADHAAPIPADEAIAIRTDGTE